MNYQLQRKAVGNGIYLNYISDKKFKHNRISINFIMPISENTATDHALLSFLLRKGYRDCPDFTALNAKLYDLYGASLTADVSKYGEYQVIDVSIVGIDNRFALEQEDIIKECAMLLAGVATAPNIVDGKFPELDMELEKQCLIDTIEAEINDKRSYAVNRCKAVMCEGEPIAVRKYGYVDKVAGITASSLAKTYETVLKTAAIEILFVGCGDSTSAVEIFEKSFAGLERTPIETVTHKQKNVATAIKTETELMDLNQSKLVMGFRTGEIATPHEMNAMRVMIALFGGTPFSKLFLNVREKLSLCYYCAARFDRIIGIMMVDSGVEAANKDKAYDEICNQLELVKKGEFADSDLADAKLTMKNSLYTLTDSLGGIEDWYMSQIMCKTNISPLEEAEMLEKVTREDIISAAQKVTLDTVYFLTGKKIQE